MKTDTVRYRPWVVAAFWAYVAATAAVTMAPTGAHRRRGQPWWSVVELVPAHVPPVSFVLNVVMFVPFGILVPLLWRRADGFGRIAGLSLAASTVIELTQLVLWLAVGNHRTVDINDLIANTGGGVLGLVALRCASAVSGPSGPSRRGASRPARWRSRRGCRRTRTGSTGSRRG